MKYNIRQKVFSLSDKFTIKNEYNEDVLIVEGEIFTLGNKLHIYDLNNNELFYIEQQLLKLLPEYLMYENGIEIAHLKKEFSLFKPKINISSDYGIFSIEGDIMSHDFTIYENDIAVAQIEKKYLSFSDEYTLELFTDNKTDFLISLVIVIDQIMHDNKNN